MGSEQGQALRALLLLGFTAYVGSRFADTSHTPTEAAVTYVAILVVSIVLHELGHAVAGWAVGAQVLGMRLGFGPRLTPAGSWLDLRPVIVAAHVTYVPPRGARRPQLLAITSAGLLVHLLLIAVALATGLDTMWTRELAWSNVLAFASNAIPLTGSVTSTTGGPNDGAHIVALLRPAPGSRPEPDKPWDADHRDAEAGAMALLTGGGGDLPETARRAESAQAAMTVARGVTGAQRAAVAHTLSLVRLLQGRYDEAGRLAAGALADLGGLAGGTDRADRAAVTATIGLAALAEGRPAEASQLLHAAMGLDRGPLVLLLASRVAATPAAAPTPDPAGP